MHFLFARQMSWQRAALGFVVDQRFDGGRAFSCLSAFLLMQFIEREFQLLDLVLELLRGLAELQPLELGPMRASS
jgi:hypothetical protein